MLKKSKIVMIKGTFKDAEKKQAQLLKKYERVKMIAWPCYSESGIFQWDVQ